MKRSKILKTSESSRGSRLEIRNVAGGANYPYVMSQCILWVMEPTCGQLDCKTNKQKKRRCLYEAAGWGGGGALWAVRPRHNVSLRRSSTTLFFLLFFFLKTVFIVLFAWRYVWGATDNICIHLDNSYICANTNKKGYWIFPWRALFFFFFWIGTFSQMLFDGMKWNVIASGHLEKQTELREMTNATWFHQTKCGTPCQCWKVALFLMRYPASSSEMQHDVLNARYHSCCYQSFHS